ncbi:MAG TPA: DUF1464 family protein, partial [Vicinamibacterales bacterium]|nr:DUF1464 family protein [Vicinamibacterales bacterium]
YGLPLVFAGDATEDDLRLAFLPDVDDSGGIVGLRRLIRTLAQCPVPVVLTPGVIHLRSVPLHRKVNRVDIGTADKVCAVALALSEYAARHSCHPGDASFIMLELGGAFTAAVAVERGHIVDGLGGTSGPLGIRAAGALDGEVAFLAGSVSKRLLFGGGAASIAGFEIDTESFARLSKEAGAGGARPEGLGVGPQAVINAAGRVAWEAYLESAIKAVVALTVSAPRADELILSGRLARSVHVREVFAQRLSVTHPKLLVHELTGFATRASQAAQGAALIADGLVGGPSTELVETLGIRDASGTALDYLHVISPAAARTRLGIVS